MSHQRGDVDRDGIAATRALLARHPDSRLVLVTVHDDPDLVEQGYAAGALALVRKVAAAQELAPAVRTVLGGDRYASAPSPPPELGPPGA
jgi:DNA-binding NarL/FixJ family response regulator